jgi:hypothetical protein
MKMKNKSPVLLLLSILVVVLVLGMVLGFSGNRREGLSNNSMGPTRGTYLSTTPQKLGNCNPDPGNAISGYNKYYFTNGTLNAQGQKCLVTTDYQKYDKIHATLAKCDVDLRNKLTNAQKNGTLKKVTAHPNYVKNGVLTCRGHSCIANGTNVCA